MTRVISLLLCLMLWSSAANAQQSRVVIDEFAMGQWVTSNMRALNIPSIAVGIVGPDREYYLETYGAADLHEPFLIGGLSQSVTALATLLLVQDGKIALTDPASKWVPAVPAAVTVEHLLQQRSGLSHDDIGANWLGIDRDINDLVESAAFGPVGTFAHASLNYAILGEVVAKASETSYADFVQDRIFTPAKLTSASAEPSMPSDHVHGYQYMFGFPQPSDEPPYSAAMVPANFVWMSAHDMVQWIRIFVTRGKVDGAQLFPAEVIDKLLAPAETAGYAMGWVVGADGAPVPVAKYHSATASFAAAMAVVPEREFGAFVLTNVNSWLALSTMTILQGVITPVLGMAPGSSTNMEFVVRLGVGILFAIILLTFVFETVRWVRAGFPIRLTRREAVAAFVMLLGNVLVVVMITQVGGISIKAVLTTQPDIAYALLGTLIAGTIRQLITGFNKTEHLRALNADV